MQDDNTKTRTEAGQNGAAHGGAPGQTVVARPTTLPPVTADGDTYLHELCRKKAPPVLIAEAVTRLGAVVDQPNAQGLPPLAYAITDGDIATVLCLCRLGASMVTGDFNAVLYAISADRPEAAIVLLRHGRGQGVNAGGKLASGELTTDTPLLVGLASPHNSTLVPLLQAGALVDRRRDKDGATALHLAAGRMNPDFVTMLLQAGADAGLKDNGGMTPLHVAAAEGRVAALQALLDHGVSPDSPGASGQTALYVAVIRKQVECVRLLLAAGANPDAVARDVDDETPLMAAARRGYEEIAAELLAAGADPLALNAQKKTAADFVSRESRRELYDFIKGEEEFRLRVQFESAHRRLTDDQRAPRRPSPPFNP